MGVLVKLLLQRRRRPDVWSLPPSLSSLPPASVDFFCHRHSLAFAGVASRRTQYGINSSASGCSQHGDFELRVLVCDKDELGTVRKLIRPGGLWEDLAPGSS